MYDLMLYSRDILLGCFVLIWFWSLFCCFVFGFYMVRECNRTESGGRSVGSGGFYIPFLSDPNGLKIQGIIFCRIPCHMLSWSSITPKLVDRNGSLDLI